MKGQIQIDYIVAVGIFIVIFIMVIQTITNYFTTAESTAKIDILTDYATSLMGMTDYGFTPADWNGTGTLDRIGIGTRAYRFVIVVNNSQAYYINQSQPVGSLTNELISFNYSDLGFPNIDINSTYIYKDGEIAYNINGNNVTFRTSLSANQIQYFTVYFDDDSNFTNRSQAIAGTNTITETMLAVQPINMIQYKKMQILNSSNYNFTRNSTANRDFYITLRNIQSNPNRDVFTYGGEVPRSGNVVALQKYFLFQNSSAGVLRGKVVVQVW